jgi:hypothetical protein
MYDKRRTADRFSKEVACMELVSAVLAVLVAVSNLIKVCSR